VIPAAIKSEDCVPDWKENGTIKAERSLVEEATIVRQEIRNNHSNEN
jgi:hypothetical protein